MAASGAATVVSGGVTSSAAKMLSKPITLTSRGIRAPIDVRARIRPMATRSL